MVGRSPLRIAVESLAEARAAAAAGSLPAALDLLDVGVAALGAHYRRSGVLDGTAMRLWSAGRLRAAGALAEAAAIMEGVLEDRIAEYEGRGAAAS